MKLGINFGTCYSSAALLLDGVLRPVKEPLHPLESCFPSTVCLTKQGKLVIGQAAENQRRIDPKRYCREFKRNLGEDFPYFLGELRMLPEELIGTVLAGLKQEAETMVNSSLQEAVITVPATYLSHKRHLMEEAARKAGFESISLLEEPVAAAIYYAQKGTGGHHLAEGEILLIYDLGGWTFDAALIQKQGDSFKLLCQPLGDKNCGGIDFDRAIFQDLKERYFKGSPVLELLDPHRQDLEALRARLNLEDWCRNFKHQLSVVTEYEDLPPIGASADFYSLSRGRFEEIIAPFIDSSCDLCQQLIQQSGIDWQQVNRILLVGGSCRLPCVKERLSRRFERPVVRVDDPELAICFGAAIYGNIQVETPALKSARGVNYTKLRDLLAAGKWKEADQETGKVMCQAAGRESEEWLRTEDIDNFPCEDLRTINQLWLHYSNGKFGFSVQKEIYESLGGTREYDEAVWEKFCDRVGWRKGSRISAMEDEWLNYSDLTFNLELAPHAHLPYGYSTGTEWRWGYLDSRCSVAFGHGFQGVVLGGLFSRVKTCNL